jgi:hypothetical protein
MLEPVPTPGAPAAQTPPGVPAYTLDDLIADLDDQLADLEEQSQPDQLTPLQVETAILQLLGQQIATMLARERLDLRAGRAADPASVDTLADLDDHIAATADRIATLQHYRRFAQLPPAQRQTILARTVALKARLLAGRARLCAEQMQRAEREERAHTHALTAAQQAIQDSEASMARYDRQLAHLLTPQLPGPAAAAHNSSSAVTPKREEGSRAASGPVEKGNPVAEGSPVGEGCALGRVANSPARITRITAKPPAAAGTRSKKQPRKHGKKHGRQ